MSFPNINSLTSNAMQFYAGAQFGGAGVGMGVSASIYAEGAIGQMSARLHSLTAGMNLQSMQGMLGAPPMFPRPQVPQGATGMSGLQQFQGLFQHLQSAMQGLMGMGQFGGRAQGYMQQIGGMLNGVGQTGMMPPGGLVPPYGGGGHQAGFMNQMGAVGNLMGFGGAGFMFRAQMGVRPGLQISDIKDKYAGLKTGMGHVNKNTNLAQLPEVKIALNDIMSKRKGKNIKFEELAKVLKTDYGIDAKVTKEGKAKALEFKTADGRTGKIADGNGNNALDKTDYKFGEAAKESMAKYGLTGLDPKQAVKQIQGMTQPQAFLNMQMMGAAMGGMSGGISGRANNYMDVMGGMFNQNHHNTWGTYQNNDFLGGGFGPSQPTQSFFGATQNFALLAASAWQFAR